MAMQTAAVLINISKVKPVKQIGLAFWPTRYKRKHTQALKHVD